MSVCTLFRAVTAHSVMHCIHTPFTLHTT
jgi:hypothetical protein